LACIVHYRGLGYNGGIINCIPVIPEGFQNKPRKITVSEAVSEKGNWGRQRKGSLVFLKKPKWLLLSFY
jgi:hypothetical protein